MAKKLTGVANGSQITTLKNLSIRLKREQAETFQEYHSLKDQPSAVARVGLLQVKHDRLAHEIDALESILAGKVTE